MCLECDSLRNISIANTELNDTKINNLFNALSNVSGTIGNTGEAGCIEVKVGQPYFRIKNYRKKILDVVY